MSTNFEARLRAIFAGQDPPEEMYEMWQPVIGIMAKMGCPAILSNANSRAFVALIQGEDENDYVEAGLIVSGIPAQLGTAEHRARAEFGGAWRYVWEEDTQTMNVSHTQLAGLHGGDPMDDYVCAEALVDAWKLARQAPVADMWADS